MKLKNKVAVITGSSRGIGRAIALEFAREGCNVVINYRSDEKAAQEAVAMAVDSGIRAQAVKADISIRTEVQSLFKAAIDTHGKIDILVNNAGIIQQKAFIDITDGDWDAMMNVCLKGPFLCIQEVLGHFKRRKKGNIINIASIGGQTASDRAPHYAAAKAGLICLTKSMARILAPDYFNVNCICPGFIYTDMVADTVAEVGGPESAGKFVPLGRLGTPRDVATAAVFLASDDANYITGHTLSVNGGLFMA